MVKLLEDNDQIRLSQLDLRLLCGLLKGKANAYELVKQLPVGYQDEPRLSYGSVSRALFRLEQFRMVSSAENHTTGRSSRTYTITGFGQEFLGHELKRLKHLVSQIEKNL